MVISEAFKKVAVAFYSLWLIFGGGNKLWTLNTWKGSIVTEMLLEFYTVIQRVQDLQQLQMLLYSLPISEK
jgi:hypothetical protein